MALAQTRSKNSVQKKFADVLAQIRAESENTSELGTKFERLVLDFLQTDSHYKERFTKVWMWADWARENNIKEKLGSRRDLGLDLVAREYTGELCGIQAKCYEDDTKLYMEPVNSFISAGTTYGMSTYLLACTGPINDNAYTKLMGVKCTIIQKEYFEGSSIDWSTYPKKITKQAPYELRAYQQEAFNDVIRGFKKDDRGQLIMACGTGKTFVSLRVAEKTVGKGGFVLYLVPSISLTLQTMREWANNATMPHRYVAVCSDKTVRNEEGGVLTELEMPATTDTKTLRSRLKACGKDTMNVIFSTYNSIDVVRKAMDGKKLDLVLCDEAHRTAATDGKDFESFFTTVHYDSKLKAAKRLYMTATPKVYTENAITKAESLEMKVASMDDEKIFGPVFHDLKFYDAVHKYGALTDFKVIVTYMHGDVIDSMAQQSVAGDDYMLPLDETALLSSVWSSLTNQSEQNEPGKNNLLQRVIVFCDIINSSKLFAGEPLKYGEDVTEKSRKKEIDEQRAFSRLVAHVKKITNDKTAHDVTVRHLDGSDNARHRRHELEWLKESDVDENVCRILSNARCLSEGIDVPALDGVVFLNPRKSVTDVVQAVGRVMRKAPGKEFGYVILPVGLPAGVSEEDALNDNKYFKTVYQVLAALRSHDESLVREINYLSLDGHSNPEGITSRIIIRHAYGHNLENYQQLQSKFAHGVRSKMLKHVGDASYYDKYGRQLGTRANAIESRLKTRMDTQKTVKVQIEKLCDSLKMLINDSVTVDGTIKIIAQHMVMSRVFDALFQGKFTSHNPISSILNKVVTDLKFEDELEDLQDFYKQVETELQNVVTQEARQNFIKKIYDNFFKAAAKKETEQLGIVYTPVEIIDFILNSVQDVLKSEFNTDFSARNVKVLDPFTGTGTFIARLLESGMLGTGNNMYHKYRDDLFANEIMLLAYYVATVNIETTFTSMQKDGKYVPFEGTNYADTLQLNPQYLEDERHRQATTKLDETFRQAHKRIQRQRKNDLQVIVGNPPYSGGQSNYNDQAQNIKYPKIEEKIKDTYLHMTKKINPGIGLVRSLYDSYILSIRWASDRIGKSGIIGFVTNASFIRSKTYAGVRACLQQEFTDVWVFDLRGNARTQGEERKKEAGNVFGSGSRAPVAITILVKNPKKTTPGTIHYKDIGNYLSQSKKLEIVKNSQSISSVHDWFPIKPDKYYDWINQRNQNFDKYLPIGSKDAKAGKENAIFTTYSPGVVTQRDTWAYNSSTKELSQHMKTHIDYCNLHIRKQPTNIDQKRAKWDSELSRELKKFGKQRFTQTKIRISTYRPFFKQYLYYDHIFNPRQGIMQKAYPLHDSSNIVICVPEKTSIGFSTLIVDTIADRALVSPAQCFPLYTYNNNIKHENITDVTLHEYQRHYKNNKITKLEIFYYVYGLLHHPKYRSDYKDNLASELPKIPMAPDFDKISHIGKQLAELHLSYETCKQYELGRPLAEFGTYQKMAFDKKVNEETGRKVSDYTTLKINGVKVFDNIPKIKYRVNGRTPLEWAINNYKIQTDKDSGIVKDATRGLDDKPLDIIPIIERLVYVGVESDRLISQLPDEFEPKDWKPQKDGLDKFN